MASWQPLRIGVAVEAHAVQESLTSQRGRVFLAQDSRAQDLLGRP